MMRGKTILLLTVLLFIAPRGEAFVVINEIHADPAGDITGDANNDGIRDGGDDEFVEILNFGDTPVDISGWGLADGVSTRHVFPDNTFLQPYNYLAVFGGGSPQLPGINWQTASSGALGLNNGGDLLTLVDLNDAVIDQISYDGIGGNDQAITRFPEASGNFVLHSSLAQANGALYSPGTNVSGQPFANATVPEPVTLAYFLSAVPVFLRRSRSQ